MISSPLCLLYIADARSPTARNWISSFIQLGHEVHVVTTFPSEEIPGSASHKLVPVGFSGLDDSRAGPEGRTAWIRKWTTPAVRARIRRWLSAFTLVSAADRVNRRILEVRPHLVHALRIPYEGMLAARGRPKEFELKMGGLAHIPTIISVWGNDFTLHAPQNRWMQKQTRQAMQAIDGLLADSQHDLKLASQWGFPKNGSQKLLPGGGGIDTEIFFPPDEPVPDPVIVNPRGIRTYVHTNAFLDSIPIVLQKAPEARFICTGIAGHPQAAELENRLERTGARQSVTFLPQIPHSQMGDLFRRAQVIVSPTSHDGTPNSVLEALACGCFPIAGDILSMREWISTGRNGLLVDPRDPSALAGAVLHALQDRDLRRQAARENIAVVTSRVSRPAVIEAAEIFYRTVLSKSRRDP